MFDNTFEGITPFQIIDFANKKIGPGHLNKKPISILKTKYLSGQTIILKGCKADYESLIDFWLSSQTWYSSDGQDYLFEELVMDDLQSYSSWQKEPNRVGICQRANPIEKQNYDRILSDLLKIELEQDYLIMNPTLDEKKVLFMDDTHYYLYYFWTGE